MYTAKWENYAIRFIKVGRHKYKDFSTSILPPRQHKIGRWSRICGEYLLAQRVKNLPEMEETQFRSPSWEYPPGKGMATHSSILAWEFPWTGQSGRLSPWGHKESDLTEQLSNEALRWLPIIPFLLFTPLG